MKKTTVFIDIGGVLLTNGWDRNSRKEAAKKFGIDYEEMEGQHHLNSDTFEIGKISIETYLDRVVFFKKRDFSRVDFKKFMFDQSQPFPDMLNLARQLRSKYGLKIAAVSNESRELNEYRIKKFKLDEFVDFFVSSCVVALRKPDADIFRLALRLSQTAPEQIVYIENTPLFVDVAAELGIQGILHTDYASTSANLSTMLSAGVR